MKNALATMILVVLVAPFAAGCGSGLITEQDKTEAVVAKAEAERAEESASLPSSAMTKYSDEAFLRAAHDGKLDTVQRALESGTEIAAVDPSGGYTALHMAAYNGHNHIVKFLLGKGAAVDARDAEGKTPLIHASSGNFAATVQTLLDAGADVNAIDNGEGYTPLMTAAALGEQAVVEVLLKAGADRTLSDQDGDTAYSHAASAGHVEIAELVKPAE